jgi:hypothetical protein
MMRQYMYKVILVAAMAGGFMNGSAHAGFEFTAPIQTAPAQQQPIPSLNGALLPILPNVAIEGAMPAAPMAPVNTQPTALTPQNNAPMSTAPRTPMASTPRTGMSSLAPANATSTQAAAPMPMRSSSQQENSYEMAVGFGKDLPLVTALRQIVPNEYAYVLSDSVPMGKTVSWNGGRPWNVVLDDMISPMGLQANIQGSRVLIEPVNAMAVPRPLTQTAMAPTFVAPTQSPVMSDAQPNQIGTMPTPPAPVVNMSVNAPQSAAQFSAPVAPMPSRIVPAVTRGTWTANRGDSLRSVLQEWAGQAGAELFWSSDFDYPLAGAVNVSGTFEEAAENILKGFEQARPKPIARLHPNLPYGPAVLVVETRQTLE